MRGLESRVERPREGRLDGKRGERLRERHVPCPCVSLHPCAVPNMSERPPPPLCRDQHVPETLSTLVP